MKPFISISLVLGCIFTVCSQTKTTDSLMTALQRAKNDIEKTQALNAIANAYKATNPKLMQDYAMKALELSQKIKFSVEEGNAELNLGNAAIILGNYPKALEYFASAQSVFESELQSNSASIAVKKGLAKAYGSIGIVFAEQSNYSKALQYHLKAVKIYEEINDRKKCAQVYNNIGVVYKSQGEDFKSLEYFLKAQKIQAQVSDPEIGITLTNIANCYLRQNNNGKALEYYNKSKASINKNQDARALGEWYNNMGLYYKATGNPMQAVESWKASIATFGGLGDKFGLSDAYLYLGQLLLAQKNTNEALSNAEMALKLGKDLGILEQIVASEKLLSEIYDQQQNPAQSLAHYKQFNAAKDSLNNVERVRKGVESAMNFEFEKREVLQKKEIE